MIYAKEHKSIGSWWLPVGDLIALSCFCPATCGLSERHLRSGRMFSLTFSFICLSTLTEWMVCTNLTCRQTQTLTQAIQKNTRVSRTSKDSFYLQVQHDTTQIHSMNEMSEGSHSAFIWLTRVMERANAHFQMKTNLQDAWSEDIHNKVMQRSKNRNKTGYLRHCPTRTNAHLRPLGTHRDAHVDDDNVSLLASVSEIGHKWKRTLVFSHSSFLGQNSSRSHTMHCVSRGGCYLVNSTCDLQEDNQWKKESYQECWLSLVLETRPQYK